MFVGQVLVLTLIIVATSADEPCCLSWTCTKTCTCASLPPSPTPTPTPTPSGCPDGWSDFNGGCYKYFSERKTWADASTHCKQLNADLVSIHSTEENDYVGSLVTDGSWIAIGFNDLSSEGNFEWTDGSSADFAAWGPNEPNQSGEEDCTELYPERDPTANWNDCNCLSDKAFVCKI
ncbi:echinoidin-like [Amphiura filiformis]|uniref:echinoidin-like n=1 Tax=Amphiura filiformis TaxID=82378 RepID=UPI003B21A983